MSPILYNIYIDDLNECLNNAKAGCELKGTKLNCLSYADDMVLLAPSCSGLQHLVHICERFADDHDIITLRNQYICSFVQKYVNYIVHQSHVLIHLYLVIVIMLFILGI